MKPKNPNPEHSSKEQSSLKGAIENDRNPNRSDVKGKKEEALPSRRFAEANQADQI
jgi:hypothetical protein